MFWKRLIPALMFTAALCSADSVTITFGDSVGSFYGMVAPVTATDNGHTFNVICDDFVDHMVSGTYVYDFSTLAQDQANYNGPKLAKYNNYDGDVLRFDPNSKYYAGTLGVYDSSFVQYEIAAYLVYKLFTAPGGAANGTNLMTYQPALWYALSGPASSNPQISDSMLQTNPAAWNAYQNALANYASVYPTIASNIDVYTAVKCVNVEQEFLTYVTPEPASFVLMGVGMLLGGVALKRFRRR